jgi:hypothetical protein
LQSYPDDIVIVIVFHILKYKLYIHIIYRIIISVYIISYSTYHIAGYITYYSYYPHIVNLFHHPDITISSMRKKSSWVSTLCRSWATCVAAASPLAKPLTVDPVYPVENGDFTSFNLVSTITTKNLSNFLPIFEISVV